MFVIVMVAIPVCAHRKRIGTLEPTRMQKGDTSELTGNLQYGGGVLETRRTIALDSHRRHIGTQRIYTETVEETQEETERNLEETHWKHTEESHKFHKGDFRN